MEKTIKYILIGVIFLLLCWGFGSTARFNKYRGLCDQYRKQLTAAEATNRELNDRFGRVQEVVGRLSETANANVTNARGIIETVERLRAEVQELEDLCYGGDTIDRYYDWLDSELGLQ